MGKAFDDKVEKAVIKRSDKLIKYTLALPEKYKGIDFYPPQGARDNAKRALKVRAEKSPSNRGMTPVGIARARDLINGRPMSPDTIKRMVAYFTRHEVDKQGETWEEYGKGRQAWDGWGGDEGYTWAKKVLRQMESADEKVNSLKEEVELAEVPKKYLKGAPYGTKGKREEEIKDRKDNKKTDYSPLPGDEEKSKTPSKYSKTTFAKKVREDMENSSTEEFLRVASKISEIPKSILEEVHKRGAEAWAVSGHRVGASQIAWSRARVYSFVTGGKTRSTADKDLWEKYKKNKLSETIKYKPIIKEKMSILLSEDMNKAELIIGKPFKTLALGKVYSRTLSEDGKNKAKAISKEINLDLLKEIYLVYNRTKEQTPVIIDFNHNTTSETALPLSSLALGEIIDMEVKEDGLYVTPAYTKLGYEIVKTSEGQLWSSPEFLIGKVYDRGNGEEVGKAQMLAVTLTPRPAQNHNIIDRVTLSEIKLMEYTIEQLQAMPQEELAKLCMEKHMLVKSLEAEKEGMKNELDMLKSEMDELAGEEKSLSEDSAEMMEGAKDYKMSEAQANLLSEIKAQNVQLSERIKKLESEKHTAERKLAVDNLLNSGKIAPSEMNVAEKAYDLKVNGDATFFNMFSERKANSIVNLSTVGSKENFTEVSPMDGIKAIQKEKGISFSEALDIYKETNKTAYLKHFGG